MWRKLLPLASSWSYTCSVGFESAANRCFHPDNKAWLQDTFAGTHREKRFARRATKQAGGGSSSNISESAAAAVAAERRTCGATPGLCPKSLACRLQRA